MQGNTITINYYKLLVISTIVILTTVLRISLLIISPLLILLLLSEFQFTLRRYIINLLLIIVTSLLISFLNGIYLKYNLLSFYYIIPFLFFLFSKPKFNLTNSNLFNYSIYILTITTLISNCIGLIQYINYPNDDSFAGIYGRFTVTQNGLSMINAILFYFYLKKYFITDKPNNLILSLIFGLSFVMGFYGGGVIVVVATFFLQSLDAKPSRIFKTTALATGVIIVVGLAIYLIRPQTLKYNLNILNRFSGKTNAPIPRKLLSYKNYYLAYKDNMRDMIFGSGPGTFNSRSAFVVGSPDYFKIAGPMKSADQPHYFKNYAYTLWNASNTGKWNDGFMNQPFSSFLAFLGEYGLLFTVLFLIYYIRQHNTVMNYAVYDENKKLIKDTYKFVSILLLLLLVIDNYAEYPEIYILFILLMKLAEKEIKKPAN